MDNFIANRINTKKTIGVSINKNMSVETLSERLSESDKDFSSEISTLNNLSQAKADNINSFSEIQKLKEKLDEFNVLQQKGFSEYVKEDAKGVNILDKFPHAGGSAVLSGAVTSLIPMASNLSGYQNQINYLTDQIKNKTTAMNNASVSIIEQSDLIKEKIFEKIISMM